MKQINGTKKKKCGKHAETSIVCHDEKDKTVRWNCDCKRQTATLNEIKIKLNRDTNRVTFIE